MRSESVAQLAVARPADITPIPFRSEPGDRPFLIYRCTDVTMTGRPAVLTVKRDGMTIALLESVSYPSRIDAVIEQSSRSIRRGTPLVDLDNVCLLDCDWSDNPWHWFSEWIVRALAVETAGFQGLYLVPDGAIYATALELLGIPRSRSMVRPSLNIRAKTLMVTECIQGVALERWPFLVDLLRRQIARSVPPGARPDAVRRLFIARRGTKRAVVNEEAVKAVLRDYDFTFVHMEDHALADQIRLVSNCEAIVGPHGAGMVFSLFMQRGGAIIEFFHGRYINPCLTAICTCLDLDYRALPSSVNPMDSHRPDDLIMVDIPMLRLALHNALRRR